MSKALHSPSHPPSQFEKPHTGSVELILPLTGCPTSITRRADATGGSGAVGTTAVGTARSLHPAEPSRAKDTKTTRRAVLSMGHLIFRFRSELLVRVTVDRRLPGGAQARPSRWAKATSRCVPGRHSGAGAVTDARRTDGGPRHRSSREGKAFALCPSPTNEAHPANTEGAVPSARSRQRSMGSSKPQQLHYCKDPTRNWNRVSSPSAELGPTYTVNQPGSTTHLWSSPQ